MSEQDDSSPAAQPDSAFSVQRILMIVVPAAVLLGAYYISQQGQPAAAEKELQSDQLTRLLGRAVSAPEPMEGWVDSDENLLADSPSADKCVTPDELIFCYVDEEAEATWQPFLEVLSEKTGIPCKYKVIDRDEQLNELASGGLHVTAVSTGKVPLAVKTAGFIPVCTLGNEEGFGYTMNLLVKADSPVKKVEGLKGKKITFVDPTSNSGFKSAFLLLMNEHQMLPDRDYEFGFSMAHDLSVLDLVAGRTDAVPVASDLFDRMVRNEEVEADAVRAIYESKVFPPISLGYVYNLAPEIRDAIESTFMEYTWEGTPIAEIYGASGADRFVPVDYKQDWQIIRDIDEQIEAARKSM